MLASWSHEGVVFLDLLSSSHSITSSLFPYLVSTDAPCSRLGGPVPPFPRWRPHSQGPRTLPHRDPEQSSLPLWANLSHSAPPPLSTENGVIGSFLLLFQSQMWLKIFKDILESSLLSSSIDTSFSSLGLSWAEQLVFKAKKMIREVSAVSGDRKLLTNCFMSSNDDCLCIWKFSSMWTKRITNILSVHKKSVWWNRHSLEGHVIDESERCGPIMATAPLGNR